MSSTDTQAAAWQALGQFFDSQLLPLAEARRGNAQAAMPLGPDAARPSYWVSLPEQRMAPADFLQPSCLDADELAQALAQHWRNLGEPDLAPLAAPLVLLAQGLRTPEAEPDAPSAFIYTMY